MNKEHLNRPEIKLVGISMRTSYECESNPATGQIGATCQRYFSEQTNDRTQNRVSPGIVYCVYTDYESNYQGAYTYFIGEEVSSIDDELPEGLTSLTIPAQKYLKMKAGPGAAPQVIIEAWSKVWQMTPEEQGGNRRYHSDFEVYDMSTMNPEQMELDLYIGLQD